MRKESLEQGGDPKFSPSDHKARSGKPHDMPEDAEERGKKSRKEKRGATEREAGKETRSRAGEETGKEGATGRRVDKNSGSGAGKEVYGVREGDKKENKEAGRAGNKGKTSGKGSKDKGDLLLYISVAVILVIIAGLIAAVPYFKKGRQIGEEFTYNGFSVTNISGQWYTHIKIPERNRSHIIEMRNSPMAAESVPMELGIKELVLASDRLYLTTDPMEGAKTVIAMVEVGRIVGDRYDILNIPATVGLTGGFEGNRTQITCGNATRETPVIYFHKGPETAVYQKDYCINVEGVDEDDVILAADKLGYTLLGITILR